MSISLLVVSAFVGTALQAEAGPLPGLVTEPSPAAVTAGALALDLTTAQTPTDLDAAGSEWGAAAQIDPSLEIHGFLSQGYLRTTANDFLTQSSRGSFELSEAGINVTRALTERMSFGLQLFAEGIATTDRFQVRADWFQLDYRFADWFGIRAGRVKLPFGLYNDIADIDSARVPILLPQSVYPVQNRNFLLAQSGGEIYGYLDLTAAGALEYRLYGGTIAVDLQQPATAPFRLRDLSTPYVAGTRVLFEPIEGIRIGPSVQVLRLDADLFFPATTQSVTARLPATLWVGSAEFTYADLQLSAEYSRWHIRLDSSNPRLFPETRTVNERAYAMLTYRSAEWLQFGSYYSRYFPDVGAGGGREKRQDDLAGTVRFDINRFWLVKLEGHLLWGTAALDSGLNDDAPLSTLDGRWGLFLVKTTAYF